VASILPFIKKSGIVFDDHATKIMGEAFDAACRELHDKGQPTIVSPSASLTQPGMAGAIPSNCAMSGWLALDSTKATSRRSRAAGTAYGVWRGSAKVHFCTFVWNRTPTFRVMELALESGE
jgi:hypothetical protein